MALAVTSLYLIEVPLGCALMSRPLIVRILIFVEYSPPLANVPSVYVVPLSLEMYARMSVFKVTESTG